MGMLSMPLRRRFFMAWCVVRWCVSLSRSERVLSCCDDYRDTGVFRRFSFAVRFLHMMREDSSHCGCVYMECGYCSYIFRCTMIATYLIRFPLPAHHHPSISTHLTRPPNFELQMHKYMYKNILPALVFSSTTSRSQEHSLILPTHPLHKRLLTPRPTPLRCTHNMKAEIQLSHQLFHTKQQPLHVHMYAARTNRHHGERRISRFRNVFQAEDLRIDVFEARG